MSEIYNATRVRGADDRVRLKRAYGREGNGDAALLRSALGLCFLRCALQEAVQTCAANAENLRGTNTVTIAHFKDALDMNSANLIERNRPPIFLGNGCDGTARLLEMGGEIGNVNEIGTGGEGCAGDDIFELADIARPVVLQQSDLCAAGEALEWLGIRLAVFFEEVLDQDRDVFRSFAQAGNADFDRAEAVERDPRGNGRRGLRREGLDWWRQSGAHPHACTSGEPTRWISRF